jgi:hypothetical protein
VKTHTKTLLEEGGDIRDAISANAPLESRLFAAFRLRNSGSLSRVIHCAVIKLQKDAHYVRTERLMSAS